MMKVGESRNVVRGELNARDGLPGGRAVSLQSEEEAQLADSLRACGRTVGELQSFVNPAQTCQGRRMIPSEVRLSRMTSSSAVWQSRR